MASATLPTTPVPATEKTDKWSPSLWGALFVLCGALFLDGLDVSMVGVALPSIQADLGLSTSALQWVVSGYVLGYGGLLLLGGRTADLLGRRKIFLIAVGVFAAASLLGGLVDDGTLLIVTRFVKGVAAAFTAPAGLSIITTTFPEGPTRNKALSIYTVFGASGFSSGLIFGGLMTEVGWRWTFLLPVPIAIAVLIAGIKLVPQDKAVTRGRYDLAGAATLTGAMLLLVFGVVEAPLAGWLSLRTLGTLALVVGLLVAFVAIERRSPHPLVRLGIFKNAAIVRANIAAMTVVGAYVGFQFVGTLYMQSTLGWSPMVMALAFLPAGLLVAFGGPQTGKLVDRFGAAKITLIGLAAFVPGYLLFLRIDPDPVYVAVILPTIILIGIGFGLAFPALNIEATNGVADNEQGLASGLVQTSFQVGGAIVLAIVTAVMTSGLASGGDPIAAYQPAIGVVAVAATIGLVIIAAGMLLRGRRSRPAEEPVEDGVLEGAV
jgi:EmrB/QacA subfamily drug resistance transporter